MADPALEKSTTQWRILMRYREVFLRHQSLLSFIDHAIEHVFDARNCADVDSCIQKVEDNTIRVRQLEADGFDTSAITIPLAELFALEAYEIFSTQIAEVQTLMDMRSRMAALSMSIGGIDRAIVGIFNSTKLHHLIQTPTKAVATRSEMSPGRPTNGFARKVGDSSSVSTLSVSRIQTNSSVDPAAAVARDHVNPVASKKRALSPEITHALDAANNGLLVESGSSKRQRTALDVGSRDGFKNIEIWQVNLKSAFTEGVYWGSGAHGELFLGFDTLSQTIVVCHRGESVLSTDPLFTVKPENISKIIRPDLHRGENLHVRLELKNEHHSSRAFDFVVRTGRGYDVLLRQIRLMTCCLEGTLDEYLKSSQRFTLTL